jgi:hypothetical protein
LNYTRAQESEGHNKRMLRTVILLFFCSFLVHYGELALSTTESKDYSTTTLSGDNNTTTTTNTSPSTEPSSSADASNNTQLMINLGTAAAGILTAIVGVNAFRQSQVLKKKDIMKDIIIPLIQDYEKPELSKAKQILDGSEIKGESSDRYPNRTYDKNKLSVILRDTRISPVPPINVTEDEIRRSFDALLYFLIKLEYLLFVGVLTDDETMYFQFFIKKAAAEPSVINYAKMKDFHFSGRLDPSLNTRR